MMTGVFIDIFPILALVTILCDLRMNQPKSQTARGFRAIVLLALTVLLSDLAAWLLAGQTFPGARELHIVANLLYFGVGVLVSYGWFLFSHYILLDAVGFIRRRALFIVLSLPILVFLVALLVKTDWFFTVTADNRYARGPVFFIQTLLGLGYVLIGCVHAFVRGVREKVPTWRREDFLLASFVVYPFIGGALQIVYPQLVLLWPFAVISILLYHINLRHEDVQKDGLTGLYNRGWLDEYLVQRFRRSSPTDVWYLFLIDLNKFKSINDTCGHAAGDMALHDAAEILKRVFVPGEAFLARYGGDEFAVVLKRPKHSVEIYAEQLEQAVRTENERNNRPYTLSMSFGAATYTHGKFARLEDFIAEADRKMYVDKAARF